MISDKIKLTNSEIKEIISKIQNSDKIMFIDRKEETGERPMSFFLEAGIEYKDAIEIIRKLNFNDYQYTQLDKTMKYIYMHIFFKNIQNKEAYIKIGFKSDKTIVISFHEREY